MAHEPDCNNEYKIRVRSRIAVQTIPATATAGLLLLVLVAGLVVYKSTGALRHIEHARATGSVATRVAAVPIDSTTLPIRVAAKSLNYLDAVWPALVFGILISAAVRAFTPVAALARLVDRGPFRSQLVAGVCGAPLMLCSCCVAPIAVMVWLIALAGGLAIT
jgi:hypothetical protein